MNSAVQDSTMLSPAHVTFGQALRMPVDHLDGLHPVQAAQDQVRSWQELCELVQRRLFQAQAYQKKYADAHRRHVEYAVGDKVLLSTKNLRLHGTRKFRDRFVGPFVITERIGNTAYHLDLLRSTALSGVYNVFHVLLLHGWLSNGVHANVPSIEIDG